MTLSCCFLFSSRFVCFARVFVVSVLACFLVSTAVTGVLPDYSSI